MTFGENLIKLRKQNKMTQEEVAEQLKITRQTISNWELNQTKPDLDQLIGLSKLYKISLDKLAGNESKEIQTEQSNKSGTLKLWCTKFGKFITNNKNVCIMIFTLVCFIAIGVCGLVDYALNNRITWGYIPIVSIAFGYVITLPFFAKKQKIVWFLGTVTITILPFLYLLEQAIPLKDWFIPLAVPITVISLVGAWITYLVCALFKINNWYKAAILIVMWAGIISPMINHISEDIPYISFQNFTNVFSSLVVAIICVIYGYIKNAKNKT